VIATRQRWVRATAVAAGIVAVAVLVARSGFGVRAAIHPYEQLCADRGAYVRAFDGGRAGAITAAIEQLRTDIAIQAPGIRSGVRREVEAASRGDPSIVRRQYQINCRPSDSVSRNR